MSDNDGAQPDNPEGSGAGDSKEFESKKFSSGSANSQPQNDQEEIAAQSTVFEANLPESAFDGMGQSQERPVEEDQTKTIDKALLFGDD